MKYRIEYHRGAKSIVNEPNLSEDYSEILSSISEIDEHQILEFFLNQKKEERELGKKNYKKSSVNYANWRTQLCSSYLVNYNLNQVKTTQPP